MVTAAAAPKRISAGVGDHIQYYFNTSTCSAAITTRKIIEVCDDGAQFIVEGFFVVQASDVIAVIDAKEPKREFDIDDEF